MSQQHRNLEDEFDRIDGNLQAFERRIKALQEQVDSLEDELQERDQRLAEIEATVNLSLDEKSYEELTRQDKAREIQTSLIQEASENPTDKAAMNYREIRFLFNGRPSTGHVYDLMDLAANEQGFEYQERDDLENRITVNLAEVKEELRVHAANNDDSEGGS